MSISRRRKKREINHASAPKVSFLRQSISFVALVFLLLQQILIISPVTVQAAVSNSIVISQVYGGGGNSGATYKNDFIELFNRGTVAVSIAGWSVQYASATGSTWAKTDLSGTIPAGGYFLIQEAAGTGGTASLPAPVNATGTLNMSGTVGKVILASTTSLATGTDGTSLGASRIDAVSYGTTSTSTEGTPTAALTNANAARRLQGGCQDTDANSADFEIVAAFQTGNPRNSNSPLNPCGGGSPVSTNPAGSGSANPNSLLPGSTTLLTVNVTPGTNPASSQITVTANLSAIGGASNQIFVDNGGNSFSFQATIAGNTSSGSKSLPVTITDAEGRTGKTAISL